MLYMKLLIIPQKWNLLHSPINLISGDRSVKFTRNVRTFPVSTQTQMNLDVWFPSISVSPYRVQIQFMAPGFFALPERPLRARQWFGGRNTFSTPARPDWITSCPRKKKKSQIVHIRLGTRQGWAWKNLRLFLSKFVYLSWTLNVSIYEMISK